MGTKVQCKSYFPGYYSMRDLNEDTKNSTWPLFYDEKMLNGGQYYNYFTARPLNGYSEYDKEALKQTMLKHEATFRNQVSELHRLYQIQRTLMDELRKKEPCNYAALVEDGRMQTSFSPIQNGCNVQTSGLMDSKILKVPRTFDLEIPADEDMVSEEADQIEEAKLPLAEMCSSNGHYTGQVEKEVNLTLGTVGNPSFRVNDWKPNSHLKNTERNGFVADLNEPIQGLCGEEAEASTSTSFLGSCFHHEESRGQLHAVPKFFGESSSLCQDNEVAGDRRAFLNYSRTENETKNQAPYSLEAGKNRSKSNPFFPVYEKSPPSTELIQLEKRSHEIPSFISTNKMKREPSLVDKSAHGIEFSRSRDLIVSSYSAPVPSVPSPHSALSCTDDASAASPSISSWRKPKNSITQVPIPCINGSAAANMWAKRLSNIESPRLDGNPGNSVRSHLSFRQELHNQNDFSNGFNLDINASCALLPSIACDRKPANGHDSACDLSEVAPSKTLRGIYSQDVKSGREINLNVSLPDECDEDTDTQSDLDGEGRKHGDPLKRIPWLRSKPASDGCSKDSNIEESANKIDRGPPGFIKDFSSYLHSDNEESRKSVQLDSSCKSIIGFPIFDKPHIFDGEGVSSSSIQCQNHSEIGNAQKSFRASSVHADIASIPLSESQKQIQVQNQVTGKGIKNKNLLGDSPWEIDLNSTATVLDISSPNDLEIPASLATGAPLLDTGDQVNLETSIHPKAVDSTTAGQSPSSYKLLEPVQLKQCMMVGPQEKLETTAAEAIIAMSAQILSQSDASAGDLSSDDLRDSLLWFSEVVSSNASDLERMPGLLVTSGRMDNANKGASDDEGIDVFEAMTLNLVEIKEDDYCCNKMMLQEQASQDKDGGTPSPLLSRPRRRQTRKRRQRRDFQKDILPGLVSLSRHEVTEDLQMLEGLMRASGWSWQSRLARRNVGRNGRVGQARGGRQPRGAAAAAATGGKLVGPPPWQPSHKEVERGGINLQGWGKTTRRCHRRQRFVMADAATAI
ncbi:hypothetical protein ACLOJK_038423 [Asimina triloba]